MHKIRVTEWNWSQRVNLVKPGSLCAPWPGIQFLTSFLQCCWHSSKRECLSTHCQEMLHGCWGISLPSDSPSLWLYTWGEYGLDVTLALWYLSEQYLSRDAKALSECTTLSGLLFVSQVISQRVILLSRSILGMLLSPTFHAISLKMIIWSKQLIENKRYPSHHS